MRNKRSIYSVRDTDLARDARFAGAKEAIADCPGYEIDHIVDNYDWASIGRQRSSTSMNRSDYIERALDGYIKGHISAPFKQASYTNAPPPLVLFTDSTPSPSQKATRSTLAGQQEQKQAAMPSGSSSAQAPPSGRSSCSRVNELIHHRRHVVKNLHEHRKPRGPGERRWQRQEASRVPLGNSADSLRHGAGNRRRHRGPPRHRRVRGEDKDQCPGQDTDGFEASDV
ncbi:hypothetical protein CDD83_3965 [Cordyceps sp. RAO-2017]|nr:hypothetical protein CDD83_3965 [Cordyceps sp. RAO-2017]